ncbi:MAG: hypothetical protein P4L40_24760 [Terracidiphilus sp.]|nr:hypothetical protein [Terracidiphilus sp.]
MTQAKTNCRKLAGYVALAVVMLLFFRIPAVQNAIAEALIEFIQITERTLRFPCALLDHDKCSSLDRFDPTCPPCL